MSIYENQSYKKVGIQNILLDKKPFSFSFPEFSQKLFDSISSIGLIDPPILLQEKNNRKFLVVSGIRRVLACKKLGMNTLPCFILKNGDTKSYEKFIYLNLKINQAHRELNHIEKANFLKLLHETGMPEQAIIKKFMPELNLAKSKKIYTDFLSINSLDLPTKMRIIEWRLPLKTSVALAKYTKPGRNSVMKIAETLLPGVNRLKEIMTLLEENALLKKSSIEDIVRLYLINIIEDSQKEKKDRIEKIRLKLKELRYPKLKEQEKKWNDFIKELHLPQEIKISSPPFFEGRKVKIEITSFSKEKIAHSLKKLNETLKSWPIEDLIR